MFVERRSAGELPGARERLIELILRPTMVNSHCWTRHGAPSGEFSGGAVHTKYDGDRAAAGQCNQQSDLLIDWRGCTSNRQAMFV